MIYKYFGLKKSKSCLYSLLFVTYLRSNITKFCQFDSIYSFKMIASHFLFPPNKIYTCISSKDFINRYKKYKQKMLFLTFINTLSFFFYQKVKCLIATLDMIYYILTSRFYSHQILSSTLSNQTDFRLSLKKY